VTKRLLIDTEDKIEAVLNICQITVTELWTHSEVTDNSTFRALATAFGW